MAGAVGGFSGKETAIQPLGKAFASARVTSGRGWLSQSVGTGLENPLGEVLEAG